MGVSLTRASAPTPANLTRSLPNVSTSPYSYFLTNKGKKHKTQNTHMPARPFYTCSRCRREGAYYSRLSTLFVASHLVYKQQYQQGQPSHAILATGHELRLERVHELVTPPINITNKCHAGVQVCCPTALDQQRTVVFEPVPQSVSGNQKRWFLCGAKGRVVHLKKPHHGLSRSVGSVFLAPQSVSTSWTSKNSRSVVIREHPHRFRHETPPSRTSRFDRESFGQ